MKTFKEHHIQALVNSIKASMSHSIDRSYMPQISSDKLEEFMEFLKNNDISVRYRTINPNSLNFIQTNFDVSKILSLSNSLNSSNQIFTSLDNYVVDGNHRAIAHIYKHKLVSVIEIQKPMKELVHILKSFHGTEFHS